MYKPLIYITSSLLFITSAMASQIDLCPNPLQVSLNILVPQQHIYMWMAKNDQGISFSSGQVLHGKPYPTTVMSLNPGESRVISVNNLFRMNVQQLVCVYNVQIQSQVTKITLIGELSGV